MNDTITNDLTTTAILALFKTNKEQRLSFAIDLMEKIASGFVNPLDVHLQIKCMEDIIKLLTENPQYNKAVLEESQKYGEKSFEFHNAKVEIKEVGVKYDYSVCGDTDWELHNQAKTSAENSLKERQKFLATVPQKGLQIVNSLTGEVETIYPPVKSSTTAIAVTLK